MSTTKKICELCSMGATHFKQSPSGNVYYCPHHAPQFSVRLSEAAQDSIITTKYLPVIIIYLIATVLAFTLAFFKSDLNYHAWMLYFMGFTFLSFGFFKILDISAFADGYQEYDLIAIKSRVYALTYPFIEILLAGLYLTNIGGIYRDFFTFILMVIGSLGVYKKLRRKEEIPCVCLGVVFKFPMSKVTLFENSLMALMALLMFPTYLAM